LHQGSKEKEEQFKEIAEAYEVVGNRQRRALYDRAGKAKEEGPSLSHGSSGKGMADTEAIIANFVDLGRRSWGGKKPF
jgi:molecular chaperone DnaJ